MDLQIKKERLCNLCKDYKAGNPNWPPALISCPKCGREILEETTKDRIEKHLKEK